MKFIPIFARENSDLWSVCYPDEAQDIFDKFLDDMNDFCFLSDFFAREKHQLNTAFWSGITVQHAIEQIFDEAFELERELRCFVEHRPDCAGILPREIFEPLEEGIYCLRSRNRSFRKVRSNPQYFVKPMLRIYAVMLEDQTMLVTGGAIKLTRRMEGEYFDRLFQRMNRVKDYIQAHKIVSKEGLY